MIAAAHRCQPPPCRGMVEQWTPLTVLFDWLCSCGRWWRFYPDARKGRGLWRALDGNKPRTTGR